MDTNLRMHVISIARSVRQWVEEKDQLQRNPSGDLGGWCAIASAELWRRLDKNNIKSEIHISEDEWTFHVFVVVEDHIVDVTATQFGHYEPVVIMHHRLAESKDYWNTNDIFKNPVDLIKHQKKNGHSNQEIAYSK